MSLCQLFKVLIMKSTKIPVYLGDAFTVGGPTPFTGNPGAICLLEYDDDISDEAKLKIANEIGFTATAFISHGWLRPRSQTTVTSTEVDVSNGIDKCNILKRKVRWFTPEREAPLCGHDTIIAGKLLGILYLEDHPHVKVPEEIKIEFDCPFRGIVGAAYNCGTGRVNLNFPLSPCLPIRTENDSLGKLAEAVLSPHYEKEVIQDVQYSPSSGILLVRLADSLGSTGLAKLTPNFAKLKSVKVIDGMIGLIVTVKGENGNAESGEPHFFTRYFAPWLGFHEDPACGSAHTVLTPYWFNEYKVKHGETLLSRHLSTRGGLVYCSMIDNERVSLGGDAAILIRGELAV